MPSFRTKLLSETELAYDSQTVNKSRQARKEGVLWHRRRHASTDAPSGPFRTERGGLPRSILFRVHIGMGRRSKSGASFMHKYQSGKVLAFSNILFDVKRASVEGSVRQKWIRHPKTSFRDNTCFDVRGPRNVMLPFIVHRRSWPGVSPL